MITEKHIDAALDAAEAGKMNGHTYNQAHWCGTACCILGFARIAAGMPEIDGGPQPGEIEETPRALTIKCLMYCPSPDILRVMRAVLPDGVIDLHGEKLRKKDLAWANLRKADLTRANLAGANLAHAYLIRANLAGADLSQANLAHAYLAWANLSRTKMEGAEITGAYMLGANLTGQDRNDLERRGAILTQAAP